MDAAAGYDESRGKASPVSPGDVLAGKYRVDRVLGVGGMGVVVAATHIDLLEMRAIKFMLAAYLADAEAVQRFLREARACAHLKGEHIAKVHDVGRLENGAPYMIMEYLTGADLGAEIDRRGAIPVHEAALYVLQACEALAEAHAAGIVHRDLKPENLFLATGPGGIPSIKVLDFGISTVLGNERELRMTKTSAIMGSPYYMSPEQTRSTRNVDARADIWSLGVILYQLVTGRLPFPGENLTEIVTAVLFGPVAPPSAVASGLPEGLDRVILRCLERELDRRYPSVADLAEDLAPYAPAASLRSVQRISLMLPRGLPRGPSSVRVDDSVAGTVSGEPPAIGSVSGVLRVAPQSTGSTTRRARTPALMIAAGATLALGIGGAALFLGRGASRHAAIPLASAVQAPSPAASLPAVAATSSVDIPAEAPPPSVTMGETPKATKPPAEVAPSGRYSGRAGGSVPKLPEGKTPPRPGATVVPKPEPPAGDPFGDGRQ